MKLLTLGSKVFLFLFKAFVALLCISGLCWIFCWLRTLPYRSNKVIIPPTCDDFIHALINEKNDDKVVDLYSRLASAPPIEKIRKILDLVSKRDNPSIIAKLQSVDPGPLR